MPAWYPRCQPLPGRLPRPASDDATRACQPGKRKWLLFSYGAREWYRKGMKWPSVAILFVPLPPCLSCLCFLSLTLSHRLIADSGTTVWTGTHAYAWQSQGLTCQLPPYCQPPPPLPSPSCTATPTPHISRGARVTRGRDICSQNIQGRAWLLPSALRGREGIRTAEGMMGGEVAPEHSIRQPSSSPEQLLEPAAFTRCSLGVHGAEASFPVALPWVGL